MKTQISLRPLRTWKTFPVLAAGVLALTLPAFSETALLSSVADSEIHRVTNPDTNYGTGPSVVSGQLNNGETRRALFRFDLSGIPPQATVTSATLRLQVTRIPSGGGSNSTFDLRRILKDWTEAAVTWNSRLSPTTPWENGGLRGSSDASTAASSSVLVSGAGPYTFSSSQNLVADVQLWVTNSSANFGWLLSSQNEVSPQTARHFAAKEDSINGPLLTINYTLPPPPASTNLVLTGAVQVGNEFHFSFTAESNLTYTVESLTSLTATNWASVTTFPPASVTLNRTVTNGITSSNQFYRVRSP